MARFVILPYAVFFLKILTCLTQHANYELKNDINSEESRVGMSNVIVLPSIELEKEFDDDTLDDYYYDEENALSPILRRVRRRIFPGVGKALDRDRPGRNPWVRTRDGYDDQNANSQVMTRDGPMGSDLLYELYPDLAPPDWKDRSYHHPIDYTEMPEIRRGIEQSREDVVPTEEKPTFKIERDLAGRNDKRVRKQKVRIPKRLKEEIAIFAEQHGSSAAVAHFHGKVNFPLKKNAVEKFMRRYRRRRERQIKRRLSKS